MGNLKIIEGKSLLVSNSGNPETDGVYLLQKTLINNRRFYIKDNTSPTVDCAIAWSPPDNAWVLYVIGLPFILSYSTNPSNNPWETNWSINNMIVSPIILTNNKISIKKQNLGSGKLSLNKKTLTPTPSTNLPSFICVSDPGDARVLEQLYTRFNYIGGSVWYVSMPSQQNFIFAPGSGPGNSVTNWELWTNTPSNAKIYTNPSTNLDIFPLEGWVSVNPSSDPVPIFTYNTCPPNIQTNPLGLGYNISASSSSNPASPELISYFGNPLDQTGYISHSLTNTNHYWTFTIANGYKIYFALDVDGYSPSNIDSFIAIRSGNTWIDSNILSQQNLRENQEGQYILSSAHPYSAGTYTLKINNSTATMVSYRIRFIINTV